MKILKNDIPPLLENKNVIFLFSFFLCLFLSHCSTLKRAPREKPQHILSDSKKVLDQYYYLSKQKQSIKAQGKIRIQDGRRKYAFDFLMAANHPSSLRLEAEHSLGGTLAIIVTNPSQFIYYDLTKNTLYRGTNTLPILPYYFPYHFTKEELVGCLTLQFPLPRKIKDAHLEFNNQDNTYLLTFSNKNKFWKVSLDPHHFFTLDLEIRNSQNKAELEISYYQFKKIGKNKFLPQLIKLHSPLEGTQAEISFSEIETPPHLSPNFFKLSVPTPAPLF
ncbi:MAG: DUF4292 domain-containing protein [Deltaproteobacteria bacterium]|nr:DUF4292 domain-containing protein [Deltaproteobacteria bacterium]